MGALSLSLDRETLLLADGCDVQLVNRLVVVAARRPRDEVPGVVGDVRRQRRCVLRQVDIEVPERAVPRLAHEDAAAAILRLYCGLLKYE